MIANTVYSLCALTSILCAGLLLRSYLRNRTALLLWSSIGFIGLAINNILLLVDLVVLPAIDLSLLRSGSALVAIVVLVSGLVWNAK